MVVEGDLSSGRPKPLEPLVFESAKWYALVTMGSSFLIPVVGMRVLLAGISALYGRVVVDSFGVSKLPTWFWGGFRAAWDEIESWDDGVIDPMAVKPPDTRRCVRLRLRGRPIPVRVTQYCACKPDFQQFVDVLTVTLGEPTGV
jgi:hypothetical protein